MGTTAARTRGEAAGVRSVPDGVLNCVVRLFVTHCSHRADMPWVMDNQWRSTSSGFVIEGRRILTCAHCIDDAKVVLVKMHGSDEKHAASVAAVAYECDTAVLTLDDDGAWERMERSAKELGAPPFIRLGRLPELQAECAVIGYPYPGETICVTQGVCSRIEVREYPDVFMPRMLAVQLDAAVNAGNSGGPVFNSDFECVGIAFGGMKAVDVENCAYFVPTMIVEHFLHDLEIHGQYTGFPELGFIVQYLENKEMRKALGLSDFSQGGVLVRRVYETSDAAKVLRRGDIVTSVDGKAVSHTGTVNFDELPGGRTEMYFVGTIRFVDDRIGIKYLRDGEEQEATIQLSRFGSSRLVHNRALKQYLIYGGHVFLVLSASYMTQRYGQLDDAPLSFLQAVYERPKTKDGVDEVVVLGQVLGASNNLGLEAEDNAIVHKVNGEQVQSLKHLADVLDAADEDDSQQYITIELDRHALVIIDKEQARQDMPSILDTYAIPTSRCIEGLDEGVDDDDDDDDNDEHDELDNREVS